MHPYVPRQQLRVVGIVGIQLQKTFDTGVFVS